MNFFCKLTLNRRSIFVVFQIFRKKAQIPPRPVNNNNKIGLVKGCRHSRGEKQNCFFGARPAASRKWNIINNIIFFWPYRFVCTKRKKYDKLWNCWSVDCNWNAVFKSKLSQSVTQCLKIEDSFFIMDVWNFNLWKVDQSQQLWQFWHLWILVFKSPRTEIHTNCEIPCFY